MVRQALHALHANVDAVRRNCRECPECAQCTGTRLVRMIKNLAKVRPWFSYSPTERYGVLGLFVLELMCRLDQAGRRQQRARGVPPCPTFKRSQWSLQ